MVLKVVTLLVLCFAMLLSHTGSISAPASWNRISVDGVESFVSSVLSTTSSKIQVYGSGFIEVAGDYECVFRTDLMICSSLPLPPSTRCGEVEVRRQPAKVESSSVLTCNSPDRWDLPSMLVRFSVEKARTPLLPQYFALLYIEAGILSASPTYVGASGQYDGIAQTMRLRGRGFDAYNEFAQRCSLCDGRLGPVKYSCLFSEVAGNAAVAFHVLTDAQVVSTQELSCPLPPLVGEQRKIRLSVQAGTSALAGSVELDYFQQVEGISSETVPSDGSGTLVISGSGFSSSLSYACCFGSERTCSSAAVSSWRNLTCSPPVWDHPLQTVSFFVLLKESNRTLNFTSSRPISVSFQPVVYSLTPTEGFANGGLQLIVKGFGFFAGQSFAVEFRCGDNFERVIHVVNESTTIFSFSSPPWNFPVCNSNVSIYYNSSLLATQDSNGSQFNFLYLSVLDNFDRTVGATIGGSYLSVLGFGLPLNKFCDIIFRGVEGQVAYDFCNCQNGCKAYKCVRSQILALSRFDVQVPPWPGVGKANVTVFCDFGKLSTIFEYQSTYVRTMLPTRGSVNGGYQVKLSGRFAASATFSVNLISPTSETLNVNTTFVNESEVSFIMPTVEFVEGFYQIEVLQGNVLLPLIASHCLQFNLIATLLSTSRVVTRGGDEIVVEGSGFNVERSVYCCLIDNGIRRPARILSSSSISCPINKTDMIGRCNLELQIFNNEELAQTCPISQTAPVSSCNLSPQFFYPIRSSVDISAWLMSAHPNRFNAFTSSQILVQADGLTNGGNTTCGSSHKCLFGSTALSAANLTFPVSASAVWINIDSIEKMIDKDRHFPFQLRVDEEILSILTEISLPDIQVYNFSTSSLTTNLSSSLLTLCSINNSAVAIIATSSTTREARQIARCSTVATSNEMSVTMIELYFDNDWMITASDYVFSINTIHVLRGSNSTTPSTHLQDSKLIGVTLTDAQILNDTHLTCQSPLWPFSQDALLTVVQDNVFPRNDLSVLFDLWTWFPEEMTESTGSARGGQILFFYGTGFCQRGDCSQYNFVCRFADMTASQTLIVVAVIHNTSVLSCITPSWSFPDMHSRVTLEETHHNQQDSMSGRFFVYTFLEDIVNFTAAGQAQIGNISLPQVIAYNHMLIQVHGFGFLSNMMYSCRMIAKNISNLDVIIEGYDVVTVSSSSIVCEFPPLSADFSSQVVQLQIDRRSASSAYTLFSGCCGSPGCTCANNKIYVAQAYAEVDWGSTTCSSVSTFCEKNIVIYGAGFHLDQLYSCHVRSSTANFTSSPAPPLGASLMSCLFDLPPGEAGRVLQLEVLQGEETIPSLYSSTESVQLCC
uniref:IPT/TIG domain-containing protein n=2 Tax=Hanusia phi TaxID=3032 RepID=A0A7S0HXA9_9CRYP|mmetsp:Transcript_5556/g.12918  ORF Transcript_5556/g.12918 Transcript_5556/m.12918 type:complete len:1332 (+) Transcript_5556:133-4128(+)